MLAAKEALVDAEVVTEGNDTALVAHDRGGTPPVDVGGDAYLSMIERAARDQNVDIDKMERLILLHDRKQAQAAELEFDRAMAAAQAEMDPVRKDASNPQTKSRYASYFALDTAIRPIYTKHGFSVSFDTADGAPSEHIRIVAKVAHAGGHRERPHIDMPADGKGAKGGDVMTKTHAMGSAVMYGRRYLLAMIFNIAVGGDDDGNAAGRTKVPERINEAQLKRLQTLIGEADADIVKVCDFYKIDALPDLAVSDFDDAVRTLMERKAKIAERAQGATS